MLGLRENRPSLAPGKQHSQFPMEKDSMIATKDTLRVSSPALATVAQVAEHLALSRSTLYQIMDSGELPYIKLGRCRRIRWTDVQAMLEQNVVGRG